MALKAYLHTFLTLRITIKTPVYKFIHSKCYHQVPFAGVYKRATGNSLTKYHLETLKKKHPNIDTLSEERLQCTLQILEKFNISPLEACIDPHIFCMNPITMDNYAEIMKECGFVRIEPKYIIRSVNNLYHTYVRSRTIKKLKEEGILNTNVNLQEKLKLLLSDWQQQSDSEVNFDESKTSILNVRMSVLEKYLIWKIKITSDDFQKYCRNYLPLKHKPMCDIQEAIHIAQNVINFDMTMIRRNGFLLSADPINTKMILENVDRLAGMDICEAIQNQPAILKNNYNALLEIRSILEEFRIPEEAQRRGLAVFCMCPATVRERLEELKNMREYQVLATNPRMLSLVIHKRKMIKRLEKIQKANKYCFSLNHLVSSSKVFNNYINSFGNKACSRDIALLIHSSLNTSKESGKKDVAFIIKQLKRHKFCLHAALNVVDDNIKFLKERFIDDVVMENLQLLMYPRSEIEYYLNLFANLRERSRILDQSHLDISYNTIDSSSLTDSQMLSIILYEIEKKHHFTGDGIWSKFDSNKFESAVSS